MDSALPPTPACVMFALKQEIIVNNTRVAGVLRDMDHIPSEQDMAASLPTVKKREPCSKTSQWSPDFGEDRSIQTRDKSYNDPAPH
jgi:hypothetical protein